MAKGKTWTTTALGERTEDEINMLLSSNGGQEIYEKKKKAEMDAVRAKAAGAIYQGEEAPDKQGWEKVGSGAKQVAAYSAGPSGGGRAAYTETVPLWQKTGPAAAQAEDKKSDSKKPAAAQATQEEVEANRSGSDAVQNKPAPERPAYNQGKPIEAFTYDPGTTGADKFLTGSQGRAPERALDYANSLGVYNDLTQRDLQARGLDNQRAANGYYTTMAKVIPEAPDTGTNYNKILAELENTKKLFA